MKKEHIITLPNPHLRQKSSKVSRGDSSLHQLINNMISATLDWEKSRPHEIGAALAAVQIDDLRRVIIVRSDFDNKDSKDFTVLINPKIIKGEGGIMYDHEGCLSVQGVYGLVPRYAKVRVKAFDEAGGEVRIKAEGFLARVLQHEIDHLSGTLFVDYIKNQTDAFFHLNETGELIGLDYDEHIAQNSILWD